jgi:hypothetical protein
MIARAIIIMMGSMIIVIIVVVVVTHNGQYRSRGRYSLCWEGKGKGSIHSRTGHEGTERK